VNEAFAKFSCFHVGRHDRLSTKPGYFQTTGEDKKANGQRDSAEGTRKFLRLKGKSSQAERSHEQAENGKT